MESGVRCQIVLKSRRQTAAPALEAVDAVVSIGCSGCSGCIGRSGCSSCIGCSGGTSISRWVILLEASQGEAVVARAVYLQKSWPLLQGFRFFEVLCKWLCYFLCYCLPLNVPLLRAVGLPLGPQA